MLDADALGGLGLAAPFPAGGLVWRGVSLGFLGGALTCRESRGPGLVSGVTWALTGVAAQQVLDASVRSAVMSCMRPGDRASTAAAWPSLTAVGLIVFCFFFRR